MLGKKFHQYTDWWTKKEGENRRIDYDFLEKK
jgi:hypothetical protein